MQIRKIKNGKTFNYYEIGDKVKVKKRPSSPYYIVGISRSNGGSPRKYKVNTKNGSHAMFSLTHKDLEPYPNSVFEVSTAGGVMVEFNGKATLLDAQDYQVIGAGSNGKRGALVVSMPVIKEFN